MKVILNPDASCPSCHCRGELTVRLWHGEEIHTLVPAASEPSPKQYACLYLRPFGNRVRARARLLAVAKAIQPFGTTVAFHAGELRLGWFRVVGNPRVIRVIEFIPYVSLIVTVPLLIWNLFVLVSELGTRVIERAIFRLNRIELVDSKDDRWQPTFRRLAFHSRLIVMDISMASGGVEYEAVFLRDPHLAKRLILIHNEDPSAIKTAEQHLASLRIADPDLTIPLVPYEAGDLRRLTQTLGELAACRMEPGH
jgi:hypothetical protein